MDDCTFDDETASQWIDLIEANKVTLRDQDIYPRVRSWMPGDLVSEILEIGSGQGICSDKIDLSRTQYTGLEPSPKMHARAVDLYSDQRRRFILGSVYEMPFEPNVFGGAFSILVWHLLSDLQSASKELARVLKPGARFLVITANPNASSAWKAFYSDFKLDGKRLQGTMSLSEKSQSHDVLYLHTEDELVESLVSSGLDVQTTETFRPAKNEAVDLLIAISGQKQL
jgi:ubiquinone/menaquinone biosynthesis C-methylase UbiE